MKNLAELITEANSYNKPFCLATVIKCAGSTPQQPGARMAIFINSRAIGTIGGGCVEGSVLKKAIELLALKKEYYAEIIDVDLMDPIGTVDGDVCGGTMKVLIETLNYS